MTLAQQLFEEGEIEGWKKGRQEGEQEGEQEGLKRGRLDGQRAALLSVLEARFGAVPLEAREKLNALENEAAISNATRQALTAGSLSDFLRSI